MKFGIDFAPTPAASLALNNQNGAVNHVNFPATPETPRTPPYNEPSLALELLNATLTRLNALEILKAKKNSSLRHERFHSILENSRLQDSFINALVDSEVSLGKQLHDQEVKKIIEDHERRKREEEERKRLAREEEERKKREEKERQKRLEEERVKKQQEEEQKRKEEEAKKKQEEEARKKKELEDAQKLKEEKEKAVAQQKLKDKLQKAKDEAAKKASGVVNLADIEKSVLKYRSDILDIKQNVVLAMNNNKDLKKNANVIKRKLNVKFGQLSSSMAQLRTISQDVISLVNYAKQNDLVYQWILNFVAKAIVAQAEAEVTVKPTAALPLARLAVFLLDGLDGLYYYLCARFAKKCALILGYTCSIDTEEGRIRMGWKRSDEKWESEVKYEERIGGIVTVWAVMSRVCKNDKFPFFSLPAEWRFMARMLNTDKQLIGNVHYGAFCNWWEASAAQLVDAYNRQAVKALQLAVQDWAAVGKQKSCPAATRLTILGDDLFTNGSFSLLKEMDN